MASQACWLRRLGFGGYVRLYVRPSAVLFPILLVLSAVLQIQDSRLRWVPNPRTTAGSWVSDPASHLRPETRAAIDSVISALERETSAEIGVAVIDSLEGLEPQQAALLLHRRWGVGKKERDNGVLFLWSPALRRTQVSVGYGLEGVLIDSRVGRILDNHVIPPFRRGQFDEGILAGVKALADAAREETYSGPPRVAAGRPGSDIESDGGISWGWYIPGGLFGGFGLLWVIGTVRRRWPRRCPRGHGRMHRVSEAQDDRFLGPEDILEEKLATVDYDVWLCDQCDERKVIPYRRLSLNYRECPKCRRRTCQTKSVTRVKPTYTSTGLREVTRTCRNCKFTDTRDEIVPMLTESSSGSGGGSSGGGSSFGGGSAGGGGAGRSY